MVGQVECDLLDIILQERLYPHYIDIINEIKCSIKVSRYGYDYIAIEFSFINRGFAS